jgi:hypothetical protein
MRRGILVACLWVAGLAAAWPAGATPVTVSSPVRVLISIGLFDFAPRGTTGTITYEIDPALPGVLDASTGVTTHAGALLGLTIVLDGELLETPGTGDLSWRDVTVLGSDCDPLFSSACRDFVTHGDLLTLGLMPLAEPLPAEDTFPPVGTEEEAVQMRLFFSDHNDDPSAPPEMITNGVVPTDASPFGHQIQISFHDANGLTVGNLVFVPEPRPGALVSCVALLAGAARRRSGGSRRRAG